MPEDMTHTRTVAEEADIDYILWNAESLEEEFGDLGLAAVIHNNADRYVLRSLAKFYAWCVLSKFGGLFVDANYKFDIGLLAGCTRHDVYFAGDMERPKDCAIFARSKEAAMYIAECMFRKVRIHVNYPTILGNSAESPYGNKYLWASIIPQLRYKQYTWSVFGLTDEEEKEEPEKITISDSLNFIRLQEPIKFVNQQLESLYYIPDNISHVYILDNLDGGTIPLTFKNTDCIVYLNEASYKEKTIYSPAGFHKLFIEYKPGGRRTTPSNFNLYSSVSFTYPLDNNSWIQEYRTITRKTAPYYAVQLALELKVLYKGKRVTIIRDSSEFNDRYSREDMDVLNAYGIDIVYSHYTVFYLLTTCAAYSDRREGQKHTWLKDLNRDNSIARYIAADRSLVSSDRYMWNLHSLGVTDDYMGLPKKVLIGMQRALRYSWDWLFKCDDDTYVVHKRLMDRLYNSDRAFGCLLSNEEGKSWASGGAGYALPRKYVEFIVRHMTEIPETGPEDWLIGRFLSEHGYRIDHESRLMPWNTDSPSPTNDLITTHYVKPGAMYTIYNRLRND